MTGFLYSILGFVVAIGLLTAIHEYGHFWTARRLGVKVLRFSIGFGKILYSWHDKRGTEYSISAIPLGGYVKMLDQNEGKVAPEDLHLAFNRKPVWARMLVIAAGPVCNLLFAVLAYWVVFMWGISAVIPILGDVPAGTPAYTAGLRSGQEIVAIDDQTTRSWEDVVVAMVAHAGDNTVVKIHTRNIADDAISTHTMQLNNLHADDTRKHFLTELGFVPFDPIPPIVGSLLPDYPAAAVGLKPGDRITGINGNKINSIAQMLHYMRGKYDQPISVQVERDGHPLSFTITPVPKEQDDGTMSGFIGVQFAKQILPAEYVRIQRYGPVSALNMAMERTQSYVVLTLQFIGKMITGKMSLQHISGPIAIAQYAGITVRSGIENFMNFLALISISLGVLNMLPIPVLDGGHFLFCMIEAVRGKALSKRAMNAGVALGMVVLSSIMLMAIYNDVLRILQ